MLEEPRGAVGTEQNRTNLTAEMLCSRSGEHDSQDCGAPAIEAELRAWWDGILTVHHERERADTTCHCGLFMADFLVPSLSTMPRAKRKWFCALCLEHPGLAGKL